MNFNELPLEDKLKNSIKFADFKTPTPIQSKSIPISLSGKDILGTAQTGTGKTLAFTIPMINKLILDKNTMALIICPTRELASQVMQTVLKLNVREIGIGNALLIGGESMQNQLKKLKKRARIIVGTPGRINDHLKRQSLDLSKVSYLVLDETDRMLDMGFTPQIELILKFIPKNHQTLLFSATLPNNILRISEKYLNNPERIAIGSLSSPIEKIKQETFQVSQDKKYHELINQLVERNGSILVFVKTKHGADKIVKRLKYDGHSADAIHGNLRQSKRERVINAFRNGKSRILVATDVAARGLDIPLIQHVINYDLPQVPEDYIHRIGRTGRAGKEGSALTFLTPSDRSMWNSISRLIDPNFKPSQNGQKRNFKSKKNNRVSFNKEKKFKDKKKFFKKDDSRKSSFGDKKKPFGYTNNPKYFNKKSNNSSEDEGEKKFSFKAKKKFKNRKRPKNFSFQKYKN
jgi:superfamily II DNA/RNA helicase